MAEAIDPVNGLPSECDYLPTIAKVKGFLEPRWLNFERMRELRDWGKRKRLPEPPRNPDEEKYIVDGLKKLSDYLSRGGDAA